MDYNTNIRAVIASFYVGSGGLDIGLILSAQGIAEGKFWDQGILQRYVKVLIVSPIM